MISNHRVIHSPTSCFSFTAMRQAVACAPIMQRARVWSPVGTSYLGEVFRGFSSPVRQMSGSFRPQRSPNIIWPSLSSSLIFHYGRQWPEMLTCPKTSTIRTFMLLILLIWKPVRTAFHALQRYLVELLKPSTDYLPLTYPAQKFTQQWLSTNLVWKLWTRQINFSLCLRLRSQGANIFLHILLVCEQPMAKFKLSPHERTTSN